MQPLTNSLEHRAQDLLIRSNRERSRKAIRSSLGTLALLGGMLAYGIVRESSVLILINGLLLVPILPLSALVIFLEWRGLRSSSPAIRLGVDRLDFMLASAAPISMTPEEVRELILMPSRFGQTLIVIPADQRAFAARCAPLDLFYMWMSRLFCGHAIGLTPNLAPEDFQTFSTALESRFPGALSVLRKSHEAPALAQALGNVTRFEGAMPAHLPPPLPHR